MTTWLWIRLVLELIRLAIAITMIVYAVKISRTSRQIVKECKRTKPSPPAELPKAIVRKR